MNNTSSDCDLFSRGSVKNMKKAMFNVPPAEFLVMHTEEHPVK